MEQPRRVGRPRRYLWDDKRDLCYKLYVEEQKSPTEISKWFAEHFNLDASELPCRKGFIRQFQAWGFPSHTRKLSPEDEAVVIERIKELWKQNVNQKDIKRVLSEEGWELKDYEFTKLWKKNGLRLRSDHGYKAPVLCNNNSNKRNHAEVAQEDTSGRQDHLLHEDNDEVSGSAHANEAAARAQRLLEIQLESDQRLQNRKRRRRIRGYGHLPPDAPGTAPRYASETSLDECKAYLHLSNEMYNAIRKDYAAICEEMGIIKKTQCAEGVWEQSKDKLTRENMHLSAMMHPLQPDQLLKKVALDCLCCDVTKRMRVAGKSITIAEASNLLGLDPTESKAIRRSMYEIFDSDNFESRLVCGEEHWHGLRQRWFDSNEKLKQVVYENDHGKMKAIDLLCSDTMKRFREDKNKRGERIVVQRNARYGPGPGPAWAATAPRSKTGAAEKVIRDGAMQIHEPRLKAIMESAQYPPQDSGNLIATLAQATGNIDFDPVLDPALAVPGPFVAPDSPAIVRSLPAYFKLAPESNLTGNHPRMWLGKLTSISLEGLHKAATCKNSVATVSKVHGVVKNEDGTEDSWLIENDDELEVYLDEACEKASFTVLLQGGHI